MIEIKGVSVGYGKRKVLEDIHFCIEKGQIVGLLGENGVGKTTLLKAIMGFIPCQEGEIRLEGKEVRAQYERVAFITEEGSCFLHMTPLQYGAFLEQFYKRFDMAKYQKLLEFFQLPNNKISKFSRGQKAKVEIAAGFSKGAEYIIMDEPFLGKDIFSRKDFMKLMATQLNEEQAILISTHEIVEIENFIDRAVVLHNGALVKDILIEEIQQEGTSLLEVLEGLMEYDSERYKMLMEETEQ